MASNNAVVNSGYFRAITSPIHWLFWMAAYSIAVIFIVFLMAGAYVYLIYPQPDAFTLYQSSVQSIAETLVAKQVGWLSTDAPMNVANSLYQLFFVAFPVEPLLAAPWDHLPVLDKTLKTLFVQWLPAIRIEMVATKLAGLRLASWISILPIMVFGYLFGIVDGLSERYIRRACGGRESAGMYHSAKYWTAALVGVSFPCYLALPIEIDPAILAWSLAFGLFVCARVQWKYFKKYL